MCGCQEAILYPLESTFPESCRHLCSRQKWQKFDLLRKALTSFLKIQWQQVLRSDKCKFTISGIYVGGRERCSSVWCYLHRGEQRTKTYQIFISSSLELHRLFNKWLQQFPKQHKKKLAPRKSTLCACECFCLLCGCSCLYLTAVLIMVQNWCRGIQTQTKSISGWLVYICSREVSWWCSLFTMNWPYTSQSVWSWG